MRRVSTLVTGREGSLCMTVLLFALIHTSRLRELRADLAHIEHVKTGTRQR